MTQSCQTQPKLNTVSFSTAIAFLLLCINVLISPTDLKTSYLHGQFFQTGESPAPANIQLNIELYIVGGQRTGYHKLTDDHYANLPDEETSFALHDLMSRKVLQQKILYSREKIHRAFHLPVI